MRKPIAILPDRGEIPAMLGRERGQFRARYGIIRLDQDGMRLPHRAGGALFRQSRTLGKLADTARGARVMPLGDLGATAGPGTLERAANLGAD